MNGSVGHLLGGIGEALLLAAGMFWKTGWSLVLGFAISAALQALVPAERMRAALGGGGIRPVALATLAGAASSSCSYASAAISRTLFKRGAGLVPSLAFLFASTNLVVELGIVLYLLLGWQFTAAEWIGDVVLVAVMAVLVHLTASPALIEAARRHKEEGGGHEHPAAAAEGGVIARLRDPQTRVRIAQNFAMDWGMLWKDLLLGFGIAGALGAFVPDGVWQALFVQGAPAWIQVPANALLGPLVAMISFVCSIGNVPMAAVLWGSGVSFGGVLAFLYADLIVLPLLDVYRRYYGWRMAAYIFAVFYVTMAVSAMLMDVAFSALGWVPARDAAALHARMTHFAIDYTFWLNIVAIGVAAALFRLARSQPMQAHCEHHGHHEHAPAADPAHCCGGHEHPPEQAGHHAAHEA